MLSIEEKTFNIELIKLENDYMNDLDVFNILIMESTIDDTVMEFSVDDVKKRILALGKKIIDMLKKFIHDVSIKIDIKIEQMRLNVKFKELKLMLAKKKAKSTKGTFTFIDVRRYKEYYKKFINAYVSEMKAGLNKDFKTVDEFEEWKKKMTDKLCEFSYTLTDKERWTITSAVDDAIRLTEDEVNNKNNSLKQLKDKTSSVINEISDTVLRSPDIQMASDKTARIFSGKQSLIGFVITKIGQCIKTIVSFITKHTFACITGLLVLLIAV